MLKFDNNFGVFTVNFEHVIAGWEAIETSI